MPTLLTFGDSNTHGSPALRPDGTSDPRFGPGTRWPTIAHAALGGGWTLVEEGLPGRTTCHPDPVMGAEMDGRTGLKIALRSHGPIDVLTIMLGTNDVKARFAPTPLAVTAGIAGLLDIALSDEWQDRHGGFRILVICPPPVILAGRLAGEFYGGPEVSRALPPLYAALAAHRGCGFLDAGRLIAVDPMDGVHYDAAAHRTLGEAVADAVRALMGPALQ
ncbi:SGNH/GDSL hydrolase family protein [Wenxinia saemankumensis]|uniref:Lysophospholipase L1 n=1 Tax=Wenxinia saemankumensis TaxID=1447782 RepID=A0A1M6FWG0_9RHOB|nr:SGNH/GDSL hydrolase family protein [Wenxinia saemankumensis]SHJ01939.1 Lysophospholipase L1 [Wenxinia saemankumensis]